MNIVRVQEVELDFEVDVTIKCDTCGAQLEIEAEEEDHWGDWTFHVVPCNCGEKEAKPIL